MKDPKMPLASVIIPTYNRCEMLKEAILSVISQTFKDFEIIVVNDGGEDISKMIDSLNEEGKIVCIQHENKRGVAAARNTAIKAARGRYIAYLDDDDVYYPDHLETLIPVLEQGNYGVVYSDSYQVILNWINDRYVKTARKILYSYDFDPEKLLISNYIATLNIAHRRDVLEKAGLFDEQLQTHEDWDLWIRFSLNHQFFHIKKVTAEFRLRFDRTSKTSRNRYSFLSTLKLIHSRYSNLITNPHIIREQQKAAHQLALDIESANRELIFKELGNHHFYAFSEYLVKDKKVLDLGCGRGMGSFLLSKVAASVVGVDNDTASINYACSRFIADNLEYKCGSFDDIPVSGKNVFDIILCYNIIKNTPLSIDLFKEIKRLLKPRGRLIISVPNSSLSPESVSVINPGVLSYGEAQKILSKYFKFLSFWGHNIFHASNIFLLDKPNSELSEFFIEKIGEDFVVPSGQQKKTLEFIAIASNSPIPDLKGNSYLLDLSNSFFHSSEQYISYLKKSLMENNEDIHSLELEIEDKNKHISNLEAEIRDKTFHISNLESEIADRKIRIESLESEIADRKIRIESLESEIADRKMRIESLEKEIIEKNAHVFNLESERSAQFVEIANLQNQIKQNDASIKKLSLSLEEKKVEIAMVEGSLGWKLLLKYRRLIDKFLPLPTKRRYYYQRATNAVKIFLNTGIRGVYRRIKEIRNKNAVITNHFPDTLNFKKNQRLLKKKTIPNRPDFRDDKYDLKDHLQAIKEELLMQIKADTQD